MERRLDRSGCSFTAILGRKFLIGFYLGHSMATSVYGAGGSLVTLLLWVYYSSLMFFFGAELTQVYATRHGSKATAAEMATPRGCTER